MANFKASFRSSLEVFNLARRQILTLLGLGLLTAALIGAAALHMVHYPNGALAISFKFVGGGLSAAAALICLLYYGSQSFMDLGDFIDRQVGDIIALRKYHRMKRHASAR